MTADTSQPSRGGRRTQSRKHSIVEAVVNTSVGYGLAVLTQVVVFPWFGLEATVSEHAGIGAIFTGVSVARSYAVRRLFVRLA